MNKSDVPIDFSMSDWEILKCEEYLEGKDLMLEWGAGGSTLYFSNMVNKFVSVEDNKSWYDIILSHKNNNTEVHLVPYHSKKFNKELDDNAFDILKGDGVNIKELYTIKNLGGVPYNTTPEDGDLVYWTTRGKQDWHCYMDYIRKPLELPYKKYDTNLIDGRARAMCRYVAKDLIKENGFLLFHDFNNRPYYHGILKWFKKIDEEESLAVLVLRGEGDE